MIKGLLNLNVRAFRIDLSSGSEQEHVQMMQLVDRVAAEEKVIYTTIVDIYGPEIHVINNRPATQAVMLEEGRRVVLTTDQAAPMNAQQIPVSLDAFPGAAIKPGKRAHIGRYLQTGSDATTAFLVVEEAYDDRLVCTCVSSTELQAGEEYILNVEGHASSAPLLSDKDKSFLRNNGARFRTSFVAVPSRSAKDCQEVREFLDCIGLESTQVMSKLEGLAGYLNAKGILARSDALVFARGKLGINVEAHKLANFQKTVCSICNRFGIPVVVTRVLDSMEDSPRPTRAEATDVANLVLDGADAILLGAETFRGKYPLQAVDTVNRIACQAELCFDNNEFFDRMMALQAQAEDARMPRPTFLATRAGLGSAGPIQHVRHLTLSVDKTEALAQTAVRAAHEQKARLLVVFTVTGRTVGLVAKYKPRCPILALILPKLTSDGISWTYSGHHEARRALLRRGVHPLLPQAGWDKSNEVGGGMLEWAIQWAQARGFVQQGDLAVVSKCPRSTAQGLGFKDAGELLYVKLASGGEAQARRSTTEEPLRLLLADPGSPMVAHDHGLYVFARQKSMVPSL